MRGLPSGGELFLDTGDVFQGAVVGGFGCFAGDVGRGHDVDLVAEVIEGEDAVEEHEDAVGNVEIVGGVFTDIFETADDVIGAIADGSGGEWREAFEGGGTMQVQEFLDDVEDVASAAFGLAAADDGDVGATRLQPEKGAHAEKCVASDFFSAFDRLEEEGIGLLFSDGEKSGNRGQQVGGDGFRYGDEGGEAGEAGKLFVVGKEHETPELYRFPPSTILFR